MAYIGDFESTVLDSSYFTFHKLPSGGGKDLGWLANGDWSEPEKFAFERKTVLPTDFALLQNHPNPINAKTESNYQLPAEGQVKLEVYNVLGERVATLVDGRQQAGYRSVIWDASEISSGVYFYKLTARDFSQTKTLILVK